MPEGTAGISVQLGLGERSGVPHNGSPGRFDDVGLVLFPTLAGARAFVQKEEPTLYSRADSGGDVMRLGNFSVSLAVRDIASLMLLDPDGNPVLIDQHV